MRLILTGDNAGRVVEDWLADEIGADTVDAVEAARIVRDRNENAAVTQPLPEGYVLAKLGETILHNALVRRRSQWFPVNGEIIGEPAKLAGYFANPVPARPDERDAKIADMGAMIARLRDVLRDAHAQIAPLESEVARLKRHRLVLTAWMRMFRAALDQWSRDERGARINIRSIYQSWSTRPGLGSQWVAAKMGGKR